MIRVQQISYANITRPNLCLYKRLIYYSYIKGNMVSKVVKVNVASVVSSPR